MPGFALTVFALALAPTPMNPPADIECQASQLPVWVGSLSVQLRTSDDRRSAFELADASPGLKDPVDTGRLRNPSKRAEEDLEKYRKMVDEQLRRLDEQLRAMEDLKKNIEDLDKRLKEAGLDKRLR